MDILNGIYADRTWADRFQFEYARYNIMKETNMFIYVMLFCEHVNPHYLLSYNFFLILD